MTSRAEGATLDLNDIGFDTEIRDGRYYLVRYQPTNDEGGVDDGKPSALCDDDYEGSARCRSDGRDKNCTTRIIISGGIILDGSLHVSSMNPNDKHDIKLLLSSGANGQDPREYHKRVAARLSLQ